VCVWGGGVGDVGMHVHVCMFVCKLLIGMWYSAQLGEKVGV
jgi:hypothetical protein